MKTLIRALLVPVVAVLALIVPAPAQAVAGWTTLDYDAAGPAAGGNHVLACKKAVDGAFGPLWEINVVVISSRGWRAGTSLEIHRNGTQVGSTVRINAGNGDWATGKIFASRVLNDRLVASVGHGTISPPGSYGAELDPIRPSSLVTCG